MSITVCKVYKGEYGRSKGKRSLAVLERKRDKAFYKTLKSIKRSGGRLLVQEERDFYLIIGSCKTYHLH